MLQTLDEARAVPEELEGVSATVEVTRLATDILVRARLRNDGARRFIVSWPNNCRAGSIAYRDGRAAIFFRAVRFRPTPSEYWPHTTALMHDGERMFDGYGVSLDPGDEIVDRFGLKEAEAACAKEGRVYLAHHELGDPATLERVFAGYDLAAAHPEWEDVLRPDGRRKMAQGSIWHFVMTSAEVPSAITAAGAAAPTAPTWSRNAALASWLPEPYDGTPVARAPPRSYPRLDMGQLAEIEGRIEYFGHRRWREVVLRSGVEPDFYGQLRKEALERSGLGAVKRRHEAPDDYVTAVELEEKRLRKTYVQVEELGALPRDAATTTTK